MWCDEEDDDIEYLNNCIRSLNFYKDKFFGEYHQNKRDDTTFIETPNQIINKKCTINPQNKDIKCFQNSITLSLYHKQIKFHPERISKIKPFINNLNWENIIFPPQEQDYQQFEMNNKSIALNILQITEKKVIFISLNTIK